MKRSLSLLNNASPLPLALSLWGRDKKIWRQCRCESLEMWLPVPSTWARLACPSFLRFLLHDCSRQRGAAPAGAVQPRPSAEAHLFQRRSWASSGLRQRVAGDKPLGGHVKSHGTILLMHPRSLPLAATTEGVRVSSHSGQARFSQLWEPRPLGKSNLPRRPRGLPELGC